MKQAGGVAATPQTRPAATGPIRRREGRAEAPVHGGDAGWRDVHDTATRDPGLGVHTADLPTGSLAPGAIVKFTFFWHEAARWENADFEVSVS